MARARIPLSSGIFDEPTTQSSWYLNRVVVTADGIIVDATAIVAATDATTAVVIVVVVATATVIVVVVATVIVVVVATAAAVSVVVVATRPLPLLLLLLPLLLLYRWLYWLLRCASSHGQ